MRITLVQPDPLQRISGGYLYNRKLSQACECMTLLSVSEEQLPEVVGALSPTRRDWVLADSLFLNQTALAPFFELERRRSCHVGLVLHALPSFVRQAQATGDSAPAGFAPDAAELELLARLHAVICPGPYLPRALGELGVWASWLICPPGAPPLAEARASDGEVGVLSVSNVTRGKGLLDAVHALSTLRELPWRWQLVGSLDWDPAFVAELREAVHARGLDERVVFRGQLDHQETLEQYRTSQLLLLPSRTENTPLVILEAQASGLPTVAYAIGGVPDLVAHEENGLLAPAYDIDLLASHLRRLIEDAAQRRRFGAHALTVAASRPSWPEVAVEFERRLSAF